MLLVPITLDEAKAFVARHHRHNKPPLSWKFGVGLELRGEMIGVAIAGRPVARPLDKRFNIEVTRVCVLECRNANSRLYGAILRAAVRTRVQSDMFGTEQRPTEAKVRWKKVLAKAPAERKEPNHAS